MAAMRRIFSGVVLAAVAAVAGTAAADDTAAVVEGNTRFALDLYAKVAEGGGNVLFSPASVSMALAMTYGGARGETATEMERVLAFPFGGERLHDAMTAIRVAIDQPRPDAYELRAVNRIWGAKDLTFLPAFLALCESRYGAGLGREDFAGDPEGARRKINFWVSEWTKKRIEELISPGLITRDTILVLTNALYFKSPWGEFFPEAATTPASFRLATGGEVDVPMMERTGWYRLLDGEALQAIEIPYRSDDLSMLVLLPHEVGGLAKLEGTLTPETLSGWTKSAETVWVRLRLPRFRVESKFRLAETLQAMGMRTAFDLARADFSAMTGSRGIAIDEVVHQGFVEVAEKGTEAAAATAVIMKRGGVRPGGETPIEFTADRPFLFAIRHNRTGSVLFLGRLADPSK